MRRPRVADAYAFAWRNVRKLPDGFVRAAAHAAADVTWALRGAGVQQLERNLARLRPDLSQRELRRTSRRGMRSYLRYFAEAFQLPGWTPEQITARVRPVGAGPVRARVAGERSLVLALGHGGNWDLAGAWASAHVAPLLTVAERLPDGLYEEFVAFRTALGIEVVPVEKGGVTFRTLVRKARAGNGLLIPLLADRDLSAHGIQVKIAGQPARVAAGPAALAAVGDHPLIPVAIYYERLSGASRRKAGSPWGLVIEFLPEIPTRSADGSRRPVEEVTQDWVDALFGVYAQHPEDWHMLQKLFLADLDPARLAAQAARSEGAEEA